MKTVVLLCGSNEAGKTKTLKAFFGVSHIKILKKMQLLERFLNGKRIFAVSLSSPQEQEDFCIVDDVKENVSNRIQKCEKLAQGQGYILIIPFGVFQKSRTEEELNEACFLEPVE